MAQAAVGRPLGELDLGDERRLHPMGLFVRSRRILDRALAGLERLEERNQLCELTVVEAGAHAAGVEQRLAAIVDTEQEGAEVKARLLWLSPAGDDEFLFEENLELP